MIFSLLGGMAFQGTGYYVTLLWFSAALAFFLVCSLKHKVMPSPANEEYRRGTKRSLYFTISLAAAQPLLMWWLTSQVMFGKKV